MPRHASQAEHYRAHREAFCLALELGCTPADAQRELERRKARARWEETRHRLDARMNAARHPSVTTPLPEEAERPDEPWMMRD